MRQPNCCDVMNCKLPYMHAGMHDIMFKKSKRSKRQMTCFGESKSVKSDKSVKRRRTNSFVETSESLGFRPDLRVETDEIRMDLIKNRLVFLKKGIDDLLAIL